MPSGASFFPVILYVADQETYPEYTLEMLDQQGKMIWRAPGLQKSPDNNFTLVLSRQFFPAGLYRIKLSGVRGGRRHLVVNQWLRIQYQ